VIRSANDSKTAKILAPPLLTTELLPEFKILALKRDITLGELLEQAMKDYLEKAEREESNK
jgi:hypothetical protein